MLQSYGNKKTKAGIITGLCIYRNPKSYLEISCAKYFTVRTS